MTKKLEITMNEIDFCKSLFHNNGPFSGTDTCKCGGEVKYSVKRNDGAELGSCQKCGETYIDHNGNRLKFNNSYFL